MHTQKFSHVSVNNLQAITARDTSRDQLPALTPRPIEESRPARSHANPSATNTTSHAVQGNSIKSFEFSNFGPQDFTHSGHLKKAVKEAAWRKKFSNKVQKIQEESIHITSAPPVITGNLPSIYTEVVNDKNPAFITLYKNPSIEMPSDDCKTKQKLR